MIIRIFITLILFSFSCKNSEVSDTDIAGKYSTEKVSLLNRLEMKYFKNTIYGTNIILELNPDSTFLYTTCGNFIKGKWKLNKENVSLTCLQNINRVDSSNMKCNKWTLKINKKRKLRLIEDSTFFIVDNKRYNGITIFVKEDFIDD